MITTKQLQEYLTTNFRLATISGKLSKDKIELSLYLNSNEEQSTEKSIDLEELKKIKKNPKQLIEYLINNYLENNTILKTEYFTKVRHHESKTSFVINGLDSTLQIALEYSLLNLLPDNLMEKLEKNKQKGIIKVLKDADIKSFTLENMNEQLSGTYKTGLKYYKENTKYPVAYYDALKIEDTHGKVIVPEFEKEFIKELLKIITEKEETNLNELKYKYNYLCIYYTTYNRYELNKKTTFTTYTSEGLSLYKSFLEEYINNYENNITDKQAESKVKKLILERKGE